MARRVRAERRGSCHVARPPGARGGRPSAERSSDAQGPRARAGRRFTRADRRRHRPHPVVARSNGALHQPAGRTSVLHVARPYGQLAKRCLAPAAAHATAWTLSHLLRIRNESRCELSADGQGDDEGPRDAPISHGRNERQGLVERELRARAHGALLPGHPQRVRPAELQRERHQADGQSAVRLADRRLRPGQRDELIRP